jgi:hypothetical protein
MGAGASGQWNANRGRQGGYPGPRRLWWSSAPVIFDTGSYPLAYPPYATDLANPYEGDPQFDSALSPEAFGYSPANMELTPTTNQSSGCSVGQTGGNTTHKIGEASESFKMETVAMPKQASATDDYHPPFIALKSHWAYSVNKYWTEGKMFHFVTTQGEHMRVPVGLVERIYPGSGQKKDH